MIYDNAPLSDLVDAAMDGDQDAWNAIVDRYAAIVWSICRQFRLPGPEAADVSQTVWLRAVERLGSLREVAALPGWLATVTRRECIRATSNASRRPWSLDWPDQQFAADEETTALDAALLLAERRAMLKEAFAALPAHCQQLLSLIFGPDPQPYSEISRRLSIPTGSIGPTRSRCLTKLRTCPVVQQWVESQNLAEGQGQR